MGRITIFNTIGAMIIGAVGFAVTAPFGSDFGRWGGLVGGVIGFIFPRYPMGLVMWTIERFQRSQKKNQDAKHDDVSP
jgi:hypothetical protein